jgi:oligopeptide/dipeptide ABC transporter ATP-binding protein
MRKGSTSKETILQINDLKTYYFLAEGVVKAVDRVNIKVNEGEALGLVGESGCGKSTVAHSILKLIRKPGRIVGGEIWFEGEDLMRKSEAEMRKTRGGKIAMVFQNPTSSLNPVFTIGSQIAEAIRLHQKVPKGEVDEKVKDILAKVGIPSPSDRMKDYPHEFSGGMCQRAMIAMALSCNPKLFIADEPTTNLDVTIQAQILDLMRILRKDFNASILLIGHDFGVISELCDRIAVMYSGKVVESADMGTIFNNAKHPYTQALLESIPRINVETERLRVIPGDVPELIRPPPGCKFHPRCEYAKELCSKKEPTLTEIEHGHQVACLQYAQEDNQEA